jgi:8-oxo-dGTP diphosphatase
MQATPLRLAATALIYRRELFLSSLLGVSRKDDHALYGLPGGKVDDNETTYEAMVREVFEETGLVVHNAVPIFFREEAGFLAVVYLVTHWSGQIATQELAKVEWIDFEVLKQGAFPAYNAALEQQLERLAALWA